MQNLVILKQKSEKTLVLISKLEEQLTSFNNDLRKVLEHSYENKHDPPSFPVDEDEAEKEVEELAIEEAKEEEE